MSSRYADVATLEWLDDIRYLASLCENEINEEDLEEVLEDNEQESIS